KHAGDLPVGFAVAGFLASGTLALAKQMEVGDGKGAVFPAGAAGERCRLFRPKFGRSVPASLSLEFPAGDGAHGLCALSRKDVLAGQLQRAVSLPGFLAGQPTSLCRRLDFGNIRCRLRFAGAAIIFMGWVVVVSGNAGAGDWFDTTGSEFPFQSLHLHTDDRDIAA